MLHTYVTQNGKVVRETIGTGSSAKVLDFIYDESGKPFALKYSTNNGSSFTTYYYVLNLQGDVVKLVTASGTAVATYTYDISGNRISKYSYGLTTTYAYDGQNNLTSITGTQAVTSTYTYDANGERLTKQNQSHTTQHYYDGVDLLFTRRDGAVNGV